MQSRSLLLNQLAQIHFILEMIRWTGLAPWEFELSFPGSLASTFLAQVEVPPGGAAASMQPFLKQGLIIHLWLPVGKLVLVGA